MRPDPLVLRQPKNFWSYVRTISQHVGYTDRGTRQIRVPDLADILAALTDLGLQTKQIADEKGRPSDLAKSLIRYFKYRAKSLNDFVEPRLMNKDSARALFEKTKARLKPKCPLPMNKQKQEKKSPAYFTGIIHMVIEANLAGWPCDYDPRELTAITKHGEPIRTLARRVDGAFPSPVNPLVIWEIKEYYYTTTFGSRVADGVYETLLDGMELEELREHEQIDVKHYLMIDDHYTWWECGRSYLCRVVDMLHMGYVDEVLFGREVLERLPKIVKEWVASAKRENAREK